MKSLASRRCVLALVALVGCLACCSCSRRGKPLYPVRGQVLFEGQPAAAALVVLYPLDPADPNAPRPHAVVGPDGSFEVFTLTKGDGAPPGRYAVAVIGKQPKARPAQQTSAFGQGMGRKQRNRPRQPGKQAGPSVVQKIPRRFWDPRTSGLVVEVHEEVNDLEPFELKARPDRPTSTTNARSP
jgi:hypothetical protein